MKKIIISALFLLSFSTTAMANFFIDINGLYMHNWTKPPNGPKVMESDGYGGGLGIGYNFRQVVNMKCLFYGGTGKMQDKPFGVVDTEIEIFGFLFGLEYVPYIPVLNDNRLLFTNSFEVGYTSCHTKFIGAISMDEGDEGVLFGLFTGFQIVASQNIVPFFKIGWLGTKYFGKWEDSEQNQLALMIGCRFYIFPLMPVDR